jgi:Cu(I)/Ag(I) efflux system membrane fusion protein
MERKILALLFLLAIVGYVVFFFVIRGGGGKQENTPDIPMSVADSADSFSSALTSCVNSYYAIAAQLAKDDSSETDEVAKRFLEVASQLPVAQLQADSNLIKLTAALQQNMVKAAANMRSSSTLSEQRRQLQIISDLLFDLLRTTQYKGAKVYRLFCPMAFDNAGANWLSPSPAVSNPYMGKSMPTCGSVIDSIHFKP